MYPIMHFGVTTNLAFDLKLGYSALQSRKPPSKKSIVFEEVCVCCISVPWFVFHCCRVNICTNTIHVIFRFILLPLSILPHSFVVSVQRNGVCLVSFIAA